MGTTSTPLLQPPARAAAPIPRPPSHRKYLPYVVMATALVAVLPVAVAWSLRGAGVVTSPWMCLAIAVVLSLLASRLGNAYWKRRGTGDLLFSDLLVWGWVWHRHVEHQLEHTTELLGFDEARIAGATDELSVERRAQLLAQLATALGARDAYLTGHSRRVARHSAMIAQKMGLTGEEATRVRAAASIHDVGKLHIPSELIDKPGKLTDEEFEAIKRHAPEGAAMVAPLGDAELTAIVLHHHERVDGTGYPDGVAGEEIPLGARIIAVADTFDALTSARPYRAAARHKQAIGVLVEGSGSQLDPEAVRAFLRYYSGNRLVVFWAALTAALQRSLAWITGDTATAGAAMSGKLVAALITTAAIGAVAAGSPVVSHARTESQNGGGQIAQSSGGSSQPSTRSAGRGGVVRGAAPVALATVGPRTVGGQQPTAGGAHPKSGAPLTSISGVSTTRGGGTHNGSRTSHSGGSDPPSSSHQGGAHHPT